MSEHTKRATGEALPTQKRAYERPQLVDYGPIAQLTRGPGSGPLDDGASAMVRPSPSPGM